MSDQCSMHSLHTIPMGTEQQFPPLPQRCLTAGAGVTMQQACTAPRAPLPAQGQRDEGSENIIHGDLNATRLVLSHVREAEVKRSSLRQFAK